MRHPKKLLMLLFFTTILLNGGCNEFFEEVIEEDSIIMLAPADGIETEIVTQTFWWQEIDGASGYRMQIVSPSFNSIEVFVVDTLVKGDKFETTLYPGDFEWRVRGENSAYLTDWSIAKLFIIDSEDLTRQTIQLVNPAQNAFTNGEEVGFLWKALPKAQTYDMKIFRNGWGQNLVLDSVGITVNNLGLLLDEGELWFGVRAVNNTSKTLYSNNRFVVDRTPPTTPNPLSPANNETLSDSTVVFTWASNDPNWNTVIDSLFVYEKISSQESILYHQAAYNNKTATLKLFRGRSYFWYLKSMDNAGNRSHVSSNRNVSVKES
jgi:hypothetical protein